MDENINNHKIEGAIIFQTIYQWNKLPSDVVYNFNPLPFCFAVLPYICLLFLQFIIAHSFASPLRYCPLCLLIAYSLGCCLARLAIACLAWQLLGYYL